MPTTAAAVDLRFNAPQFTTYGWLFDAKGCVKRRRTVMLPWGRGVGKSWFRRQIWWTLVAQFDGKPRRESLKPLKGVRITSMMPTLKQFKDVHGADIETELAADGPWGFLCGKYDRQSGQVTFPGGSWVKPFPATAYNAKRARGMRTDVLDTDEVDDIDADVYDSVAIPWLSEPWSLGVELPGGTPTRGRHGLWWRVLEATRLGRAIRRGEIAREVALEMQAAQAVRDVLVNLAPEDWPASLPADIDDAIIDILSAYFGRHATYRDAPETVSALAVARAKADTPEPTFKREWHADPDAGEGLVYAFDEDFHVRDPPPNMRFREYHVGVDHGFVDPAVMILFGVAGHGEDAVAWALDESYESGIQPSEWDERAQRWPGATFWCDPSRPDRISALRNKGLAIGSSDGPINPILPGLARMGDMIAKRAIEDSDERWSKFYVSRKCANLIREFGLYRRKKRPDGSFAEEPEDKNNHAMDAARYFCFGRFGAPPNYRHELRA